MYISAVNALFYNVPGWSAYQASKTAMDQWGRAAAAELVGKGVRITAIYLPLVRTRMIEPTEVYRSMPAMMPEQAATVINRAMIRRARRWSPWWSWFPAAFSFLFPSCWSRLVWMSFKKRKV